MKHTKSLNLAILATASFLAVPLAVYAADDHAEHEAEKAETHEDNTHNTHVGEDSHDSDHEGGQQAGHGDDHAEEGGDATEINPDAAGQAGVVIKQAQPADIAETIVLTGRIALNRNTTVNVRGRFPGMVKSVHVNLGEKVKPGQLLAKIESNESLQVYEVRASASGVILERDISPGDVAGEGALFKIADLSDVWAELHIFPKDLGHVREGMSVRIRTLDGDYEAQAKISLMLPTADRPSQTVLGIVVLPNPNEQWRPGMTVEGVVTTREKQAAVVVETSALQTLEERQVVFVKEDNRYEARQVEVGISGDGVVEILSGLKAGESYVAAGSFTIKADIGKESTEHGH
jgi:cobalt-zinc-cadmium efflux system membrane fusion protein